MRKAQDLTLLRLIKVIPPIIVVAFAIWVNFIVINDNKIKLSHDIKTLQQNFIETEKETIKAQINQLHQQINYEINNTENTLKENIKNQIYQAYNIATTIYQQNKHKSEAAVTKLITDALRSIRFNQGRGYFFIYKTTGLNVMHPVLPAMEGHYKGDLQDTRGNYIVRDMGKIVKQAGEAFYHWWFVKPQNKGQEFEKIGFGKYFAPYDWFIGTGEYVIDVENDIKTRLLKRIDSIRYGNNGYIFVLDYQGNILSNYNKKFVGTNRMNVRNAQGISNIEDIIKVAKQGEGFLNYVSYIMPSTGKSAEKISFIKGLPDWEWAIGTGTYISEIESYLAKREAYISEQNKSEFLKILFLSLFLTLFFITLSIMLSNYLARRFSLFESKINKDFTELNKIKEQLQYQALHDSLTQLPNRALLDDRITQGMALSKQKDKSLAVVFVDLDDFKKINDLYGHSIGDSLLKVLGGKFKLLLSAGESVARFGGDEFIFCFPELDNLSDAEHKVECIREIFNTDFIIDGKLISSSCSIGVAMYPNDGDKAEDLISKADIVLYKSKLQQKGHFLFFNDKINKQVKRDFILDTQLRAALINNELTILYQPQINVKTGKLVSVEALSRWNNKLLGLISPDEFIHVAEDIGMINEIGHFVIKQSMLDILKFNQQNATIIRLSINISPKQLVEPQFVEQLLQTTKDIGFDNRLITLEITENVLIANVKKVQPVIQQLKNAGFKLSLDDFGTGYSSLFYLNNLPINEIKIDKSFIDQLLTNNQSESLVKTIIAIGQLYQMTVVAEGVETKEQYERLIHLKCDKIQGYYFDRPLSIEVLTTKYK
jgi:diguanylate cyclase (GGDEF)-like protein